MAPDLRAFKSLKAAFPTTLNVIGNAALAGVLFGLETLLEKIRPCPCDPELNIRHVTVVFAVPAVILLMVSLTALSDSRKLLKGWTGRRRTRAEEGGESQCSCCWKQCHFALTTLLKAFMPPFIWIIILLLDGDHYVCYYREAGGTHSCQAVFIPNPTSKDKSEITQTKLHRLCIKSWEYGGGLLAASACLLVILRFLPTRKCGDCTLDGYYEAKYKKKMKKAIEIKMKEKMKAKIKACADVEAEKLMDDLKLSKTGQKEQNPTQSPSDMELQDMLRH